MDNKKIREKNIETAFLNLQLSPEVHTYKECHRRFRYLAKFHHPDKGGNEETFKIINSSWQIIKKELNSKNILKGE